MNDRAPGVPGPTVLYWLAWAIPQLTVYCVGGVLFWRRASGRWFVGNFLVAFFGVSLVIVPFVIGLDVGGFAPG